jgi:hypothetical protein
METARSTDGKKKKVPITVAKVRLLVENNYYLVA